MIPHNILQTILPPLATSECYHVLGLGEYAHPETCGSVEEMLRLGDLMVEAKINSYMALASFEGTRAAANARHLRCLWADLDVAKPKNSYPTAEEALQSLKAFVNKTGLTPTYIIFSGAGLHIYWALQEVVTAEQWDVLATHFAALCQQEGLIVDPACSTDKARILRMPGTIHQRTGNQVTCLRDTGVIWGVADFCTKMAGLLTQQPQPVIPQQPVQRSYEYDPVMAQFGMSNEPTADAEKIVTHCRQMQVMGLGAEPLWHRGLMLLKCCKNGEPWAHALSALDTERYDESATDTKLSTTKAAPTKCSTFDQVNPGVCTACPHWGRLTSPIQLTDMLVQSEQPAAQAIVEPEPVPQHLTIPDEFVYPPLEFQPSRGAQFKQDNGGLAEYVQDVNTGTTRKVIISRSQLHFLNAEWAYEGMDWELVYRFNVTLPGGVVTKQALMPAKILATPQSILAWAAGHLINIELGQAKRFMAFISAYISQISGIVTQRRMKNKYSHFGWNKVIDCTDNTERMGYVTEGCVITRTGAQDAGLRANDDDSPIHDVFTHAGSLEAWKLIPKFYSVLDQPLGQLVMCMSFAAPLFYFLSGDVRNCLFNIFSRDGGRGKSSLLYAAASIWGNPDKAIFQKDSSSVARMKRLALWYNMPAMMDELSHTKDEDLGRLVFAIVGGVEKQKLTSDSGWRVTGEWATCTFATANKPLKDAAARFCGDSDAGVRRIIDYECDFKELTGDELQLYRTIRDLMGKNYGLAGPEFIYQLLQHPEYVAALQTEVTNWAVNNGFAQNERYYAYPLALGLIAGRWACKFGLLDYDMDAVEKYVLKKLLPAVRRSDSQLFKSSFDILQMFIDESLLRNTLIVRRDRRLDTEKPMVSSTDPDTYICRKPIEKLTIRYELENQSMYISSQAFADWCTKNSYSWRLIIKELEDSNIIQKHRIRLELGKYVPWLTATRIRCFVVTPAMLGSIIPEPEFDEGGGT